MLEFTHENEKGKNAHEDEAREEHNVSARKPMYEGAPLISVIVAIYNVESYLSECIESILSQTYSPLEIILIDDGSKDASGLICDKYAENSSLIKAFHKENGGLSDARNYGLRCATGLYIVFVDGDDFVSPFLLESLYGAVLNTGAEIAAMPDAKSFHDGDACKLLEDYSAEAALAESVNIFEPEEYIKRMLYQELAAGAPMFLYARKVLGCDPFPVGLYYEDLASTYRFVGRSNYVALLDCTELYGYRLRSTGIIRQPYSAIKSDSAIIVAKQLYSDISSNYPLLEKAACSRCFSVIRMVFAQVPRSIPGERSVLWNELSCYKRTILRDKEARKRERVAAAIACFGYRPFVLFCAICRRMGLMR